MILLLWLFNFVVSWFNAYSVGSVWDSAKARGGMARFMAWMGATMAASGTKSRSSGSPSGTRTRANIPGLKRGGVACSPAGS